MLKIIKLTVFLAIISGLSGLCLSFVNSQTAPIIAESGSSKETEYLGKIFENVKFTEKEEKGEFITKSYSCDQGVIYKAEVKGYGSGGIVFLIGINPDGQYVGYQVVDASTETKGIGDRILEEDYVNSILELTIDDEVDTISGATISSSAISKGFAEAAEIFGSK